MSGQEGAVCASSFPICFQGGPGHGHGRGHRRIPGLRHGLPRDCRRRGADCPGLERRGRPALKRAHPEFLLMGERDCLKPEGFDFGNSPTEIRDADLAAGPWSTPPAPGRGVSWRPWTAPTRSWPCLLSILRQRPPTFRPGCRRWSPWRPWPDRETPAPEDKLCAMYLKNELEGLPNSMEAIRGFLRNTPSAEIFLGKRPLCLKPIMICAWPWTPSISSCGPVAVRRGLRNSSRWVPGRAGWRWMSSRVVWSK